MFELVVKGLLHRLLVVGLGLLLEDLSDMRLIVVVKLQHTSHVQHYPCARVRHVSLISVTFFMFTYIQLLQTAMWISLQVYIGQALLSGGLFG